MFNAEGHELLPELTLFGKYNIDLSENLVMTMQICVLNNVEKESSSKKTRSISEETESEEMN